MVGNVKRMWQIMELEDQPSHQTKCKEFFEENVVASFLKEHKINGAIIKLIDLLPADILVPSDYDLSPPQGSVNTIVDKNEKNKKRCPIYTRDNTLEKGWKYVELIKRIPIDLILLDIKMNEYEEVDVKTDEAERKILKEYTDALIDENTAFKKMGAGGLSEFREMGGCIVFGKIMRILKADVMRPYSDPPPIIILQTASRAIDYFSVLEYSFPDLVRVVGKPEVTSSFYRKPLMERIRQLIENGNINPLSLEKCLEILCSSENYPLSLEICKEIFCTPLNSDEDGWIFGTLFPWVCSDILRYFDNITSVNKLIEEICSLISGSDWTAELWMYWNSKQTPVKILSHPPDSVNTGAKSPWDKSFKDIVTMKRAGEIKPAILKCLPHFMMDVFNNNSTAEKLNQQIIARICRKIAHLPENQNDFEKALEEMSFCFEIEQRTYESDDCKNTTSCSSRAICDFWNIKNHARGCGEPLHKFVDILNENIVDTKFTIGLYNENHLPFFINPAEQLLKIDDHKFKCEDKEFEYIYFPWDSFKNMIIEIKKKVKEQVDELSTMNAGIYYKSNNNKLFIILNPVKLKFVGLEKSIFKGNGTFDEKIQSLKYWIKMYIAYNNVERVVYMQPDLGKRKPLGANEGFKGTRYIIEITTYPKGYGQEN